MCGRFVLEFSISDLVRQYQVAPQLNPAPRYNIAPGQQVLAVRQNDEGVRELASLKWGLVPVWAKDAKIGYKMINARSETVYEKPSFKQALKSRRCIIPASGFYEWQRHGKQKVPHYISHQDGTLMSFAGIWEHWRSPEGEILETCALLTTAANRIVAKIHERMPVILAMNDIEFWLSNTNPDSSGLDHLYQPYPSALITMHEVSPEVNRAEHDYPDLIKAVKEL